MITNKSKLPVILAVLFCLIFVNGCRPVQSADNSYLSIAATTYDNGKNSDGGMSTHIFCYDFSTKKAKEIYKVPYTSQYPLAVYSREDHCVYYSYRIYGPNTKGDQLFSYDLSTRKTAQLTTDVFAINNIIPTRAAVIISAAQKRTNVVKPAVYNKKNKTFQYIDINGDSEIRTLCFNPYESSIQLACQSVSAEYTALDNNNTRKTDGFISPDTSVYSFDTKNMSARLLFTLNSKNIFRMTEHNNQLYYISARRLPENTSVEKANIFNIQTKKTSLAKVIGEPGNMSDSVFYNQDNSRIYYIRSSPREVVEYDLDTRKVTPLFRFDQGYINNFILLK